MSHDHFSPFTHGFIRQERVRCVSCKLAALLMELLSKNVGLSDVTCYITSHRRPFPMHVHLLTSAPDYVIGTTLHMHIKCMVATWGSDVSSCTGAPLSIYGSWHFSRKGSLTHKHELPREHKRESHQYKRSLMSYCIYQCSWCENVVMSLALLIRF